MRTKKLNCTLVSKTWLTPAIFEIKFKSDHEIVHEPGQVLNVRVPSGLWDSRILRRGFTLSTPPGAEVHGICVPWEMGDPASEFLNSIRPGSSFVAYGPSGDTVYRPHSDSGHSVCVVCTGAAVAGFHSWIHSSAFQKSPPFRSYLILGAPSEDEVPYRDGLRGKGVELVLALKGSVADCLRSLPESWKWQTTDFYIFGEDKIVLEVENFLRVSRGVAPGAIHCDVTHLHKDEPDPEIFQFPSGKFKGKAKARGLRRAA